MPSEFCLQPEQQPVFPEQPSVLAPFSDREASAEGQSAARIHHRGKPAAECPDTPRYKALGNGWAVNCARWICQRIQKHDMEKQNGTE